MSVCVIHNLCSLMGDKKVLKVPVKITIRLNIHLIQEENGRNLCQRKVKERK